jgi:hypothetical protein
MVSAVKFKASDSHSNCADAAQRDAGLGPEIIG